MEQSESLRGRGEELKKTAVFTLVMVCTACLSLALIPKGYSQADNIKVLSYSWYTGPATSPTPYALNQFDFIVVGEIQNQGTTIADHVSLTGIVYLTNGTIVAESSTVAFVEEMLPQQKAPFYMDFAPYSSSTGDLSWANDVGYIGFQTYVGNTTDTSQYQGLRVVSNSSFIDPTSGVYNVTGTIQNTGNETTGHTWVVATFYNATGTVIGVSYTGFLADSLDPFSYVFFGVSPFDGTSQINNQITSYALLIQTRPLAATSSPSPSPTSSSSPLPTSSQSPTSSSPTQPTSTPSGGTVPIPISVLYAAIAAIVVIVVVVTLLLIRKKPRLPPPPPPETIT
jgi:hypothetical protein